MEGTPMDKRSQSTIKQIKEAFLSVKERKAFNDITVTDICREAYISRGTFYVYFDNTAVLLEAILDDAFSKTKDVLEQLNIVDGNRSNCGKYPMCQFIRENKSLHSIFLDETLTSRIVTKLIDISQENFIERMKKQTALTEDQIKVLFYFQCNGCLAVIREMLNAPESSWCNIQCILDCFISAGYGQFWDKKDTE